MIVLLISLATILFGFFWSSKVKKPVTQKITILLSVAALTQYDNFIGLSDFSFFLIAFVSILAGVEPSHSINLKSYQKSFFLLTSIVFVLFALEILMNWPITLDKGYFGIAYIAGASIVLLFGKRKLKTRLGIMVVWLGIAIDWIF